MDFLEESYKKTGELHHAYLLEGGREEIRQTLIAFIEKSLKQEVKANPDVWHRHYETLTVDDARDIRDIQSNKALAAGRKIFILEMRFMTIEAQNALLKVFEEPTPNTHFFIIIPSVEIFLPTLRSRAMHIRLHSSEDSKENAKKSAQNFLESTYKERLALSASLAESKDKAGAIELIEGLLFLLTKAKERDSSVLNELLSIRGYLNDRSPSLKMLLEHIALIV